MPSPRYNICCITILVLALSIATISCEPLSCCPCLCACVCSALKSTLEFYFALYSKHICSFGHARLHLPGHCLLLQMCYSFLVLIQFCSPDQSNLASYFPARTYDFVPGTLHMHVVRINVGVSHYWMRTHHDMLTTSHAIAHTKCDIPLTLCTSS